MLLALGCWYFAPRVHPTVAIDTRLVELPLGESQGESLAEALSASLAIPGEDMELLDQASALPERLVITPLQRAATAADSRRMTSSPTPAGIAAREPTVGPRRKVRSRLGAGGQMSGAGFGTPRFGSGRERIRGVTVKVGDPQFTLIWNTEGVDIDLHVIEPRGDEIFYGDPNGEQGGELDVDNVWGYGPENIYWLVDSHRPGMGKVKGPGPPGTYQWYVVYYASHVEFVEPTYWQVRVKHDGKVHLFDGWLYAPGDQSARFALKVHPPREPHQGTQPEAMKHRP
jgi:hypothetical protein